MKRRQFFIGLITALALGRTAFGQQREQGQAQGGAAFISTIDDLPLMPGLNEEAGGVVFDSPGGRIVDAYATGDVSQTAVRDFYADTLPQLGWRALSVGVYQRENEILKVDFPGGPGAAPPLTVGFSLAPKSP